MKSLPNFLSIVKVGCLQKKANILIKKTRFNLLILNKLYLLGYIRGYNFDLIDAYKILVFLKYYKNEAVFSNFNFIGGTSNNISFDVTSIRKEQLQGISLNLFTTSQGLLTGMECVVLNTGGFLLFYF